MAEIHGPKAPKDPTKKRPGFYIMRDKDVLGSPTEDGRGVCPIYEDMGRLINSAVLSGGIDDKEILGLLETTEGFRKLVHSIGVRAEMPNREDSLQFVFQMYGKTDQYNTGTNIIGQVPGNGMEIEINLEDVDWGTDDKEPGQIRFEFEKPEMEANVSVMLYLNDGYTAPAPENEIEVKINSPEYKKMIEQSLIQKGNNYRLKKAMEKAQRGEDVTLAFIGGSITQGAGAVPINTECYARKIYEGFCRLTDRAYDDNVHFVKAGVGGTPSELGMIRYKKDVLGECTPDIVVIEFAVNDDGDETQGECYDSLTRMVYDGEGNPAVILLFSVFADDFNLQERLSPVGYKYKLPMVSVKNSVTEQFYLKNDSGRIITKNQFFYDKFHPTNIGHTIMADGVIYMMSQVMKDEIDDEIESLKDYECAIGSDFVNVKRIDRAINDTDAVISCGSFSSYDTELQCVERNMDLKLTPQFADNYMKECKADNSPFIMDVTCKIILLVYKDSGEAKVGRADVYVDGVKSKTIDPLEVGWTHCNAVIIHRGNETKQHHVEIKMAEGYEDKEFTILGFGIVE